MRFRYKDKRGKVVSLPDVASLLWAIREGSVTPETQLAVGDDKTFQQASLVTAFQQASVAVSRSGGLPMGNARVVTPWHKKKNIRIALGIAAVVLVAAVASLRIQAISRANARAAAAAAPSGPSLSTRNAVTRYSMEFGDSAASAQLRLEAWVDQQRFGDKLRGGALRSPGSLRGVRASVAKYRVLVDSLLGRTKELAIAMVQRADSAETGSQGLDGLMEKVEDAMVDWQRELTVYADVQRSVATALDSLAIFLLDRQQSFVIRDGQPVFLSRKDASRLQELTGNLGSIAAHEKAWADALQGRRPEWMSSLAEGNRPRFGRNVLSGPTSSSP